MGLWSRRQLDALVSKAIVNCHDEHEQLGGLITMVEEHLETPFATQMLGVDVTVRKVDLRDVSIVAICQRGRIRQPLGILDLPLLEPAPNGVEWSRRTGIRRGRRE